MSTKAEPIREFTGISSLQGTWREGLLILMYHIIETPSLRYRLRYLCVNPHTFRTHLREVMATGAPFVSAEESRRIIDRERRVLITFDDAFQSIFLNALPVLRELAVPALAYVVAGQIGGSNVWDRNKGLKERPLMSRTEIFEWVRAGCEIGAHTMTHRRLTNLSPAEARLEIFDSKKVLEDLLGQPIRHFCYPYGGSNEMVRDLVREAGFESATTVDGGYNFPETDSFVLKRMTAQHRHPDISAGWGALRSVFSRA